MSIATWRRHDGAMSVERLLELELPVSRIEGKGWLRDSFRVLLVDSPDFLLYGEIARSDDGYYASMSYETLTGGARSSVQKRGRCHPGKIAALRAMIEKAMNSYWITKHQGNMGKMQKALEELKKHEYVQLTLF